MQQPKTTATTKRVSLLNPMSNNSGKNSVQPKSNQTATSSQDEGNNLASSRPAEVKSPDTSPLEESEDPADGIAPLQSPGAQYYPSGRKMRKKTSLTQSDDGTDSSTS